MPHQSSGPTAPESPESIALVALWAIEDSLGSFDAVILNRPDTTVVLVESIDAWEAWSLALIARHFPVEERLGEHMQVTQTVVGARPVMVLHGALDETTEWAVAA